MLQKFQRSFLFLLGVLLLLNLVQAYFTELIFDEAYYWHYAQEMAFGYFDHPPMVAWMIKLSSFFFDGELGVRFVSCLLSSATLILLWMTIEQKEKQRYVTHFFLLAFSMTLLNAYGFFTLPDTPLLFFTALFLYSYQQFIKKPSLLTAIGMGLVMAALMYSKYHAVLVIVFVLLSNLKLLRNSYAWLAVLVSLTAYSPHFLWLYENDFVSIKYHLFERPNAAYSFEKYTLGFFVNMIALFGLTFPWVYRSLFKVKARDTFTKALIFLVYGILIFFFISSFSRRIQTQWIIAISIPLLLIVFNDLLQDEKTRKWIFRMGIINSVILLYLRLGLVLPALLPIHYESHGNRAWVGELQSKIGDTPVVFENTYRLAPMYAFYTGNLTFSLNNINYRQNQYSIDHSEQKMQGKDIFYVSPYLMNEKLAFTNVKGGMYYGKHIDNFESYRRLRCYLEDKVFSLEETESHLIKVYNPYEYDIDIQKLRFAVGYLNDYKRIKDVIPMVAKPTNPEILTLKSNDTTNFTFKFPKPKKLRPGYFRIGISENQLHYGLNGNSIKLE